jgi:microcystin-dependent protein
MADPFIGEIRIMPYTFAPRGWARCDGQTINIMDYTALFSIIGTTYGGDGRVTMGLPNLQGRVPMHWGNGPGLTPWNIGNTVGLPAVPLNNNQIPSHSHSLNASSADGTQSTPGGAYLAAGTKAGGRGKTIPVNTYGMGTPTLMETGAIGSSGHGQGHENRQPFTVVPFCIALIGLYPSRN